MSRDFNLEQEAEYVLGMMDMYPKDSDIISMLRMKELTEIQVQDVMGFIKSKGYKKRIGQARKILVIGLLIVAILGPLWLYMSGIGIYNANDAYIERAYSRTIIRVVFYGFIYGIIQAGYGLYNFISYSIKLKSYKIHL
ncbi:MAG TPA: hypothetical protein VIZ28_08205 [Chitinophagaceae bacterium]